VAAVGAVVEVRHGGRRSGGQARVVVTPDDLALVYVRRPAMRAVVDQTLATARQEPARMIDELPARQHWLPEAE
jgi:hypothetical protein